MGEGGAAIMSAQQDVGVEALKAHVGFSLKLWLLVCCCSGCTMCRTHDACTHTCVEGVAFADDVVVVGRWGCDHMAAVSGMCFSELLFLLLLLVLLLLLLLLVLL